MQDIPTQKALQEILESKSFDKLKEYSDTSTWQNFAEHDRKLLCKLFIMSAQAELEEPKTEDPIEEVKKIYTLAAELQPKDGTIWFLRGTLLATEENKSYLEEASLCFEKALQLKDDYFDAWLAWGKLFVRRSLILDDPAYLTPAEQKFSRAESLLAKENLSNEQLADFYWQSGFLSFMIGRNSEEAIDLHKAIQSYRKAKEYGLEDKEFYNDFGNALVELGLKITQLDMLYEAIELYLVSLDDEPDPSKKTPSHSQASRYFNLGSCYHYLFEMHHDELFFKQAEESLMEAIALFPVFLPALRHLAYLRLYASKLWQDVQYLQSAVTLFAKAADISREDPQLLIHWSEALCHLGTHEEELELLQQAEALAEVVVEHHSDLPEAWAAQGLALYCLGRYFEDEEYYLRAEKKLEEGLALNQKLGTLWHYMANVKFTYGEEMHDLIALEEAITCFEMASKGEPGRFGYFWNDWGVTLLNIADITHDQKVVEGAVEKFEQAVLCQEQVHPQWLINFGSALDFLGDLADDDESYEKAIQILQHTLTIDSEATSARYQLGLAMSHLGELRGDLMLLQKAISEFQTVVEQDPEDENAYNDLGLAYLHVAELSVAVDPEVIKSLFDQANVYFLQAQSLGSLVVLYNLGCLHALQGHADESVYFLKKARDNGVLPPIEDVADDNWLDGLKNAPQFQAFIKETQN